MTTVIDDLQTVREFVMTAKATTAQDEDDALAALDRIEAGCAYLARQELARVNRPGQTRVYKSDRDMPLILTHGEIELPHVGTVTAEMYVKWYKLFLVSEGVVHPIDFHELEPYAPERESAFVDHVPNPTAIQEYCEQRGLHADPVFLEVAHGRWLLEVRS